LGGNAKYSLFWDTNSITSAPVDTRTISTPSILISLDRFHNLMQIFQLSANIQQPTSSSRQEKPPTKPEAILSTSKFLKTFETSTLFSPGITLLPKGAVKHIISDPADPDCSIQRGIEVNSENHEL